MFDVKIRSDSTPKSNARHQWVIHERGIPFGLANGCVSTKIAAEPIASADDSVQALLTNIARVLKLEVRC